ncbi:MAG: hypothetical protein HC767_13250 [Akkermansiaceae bacterium]|nr:hypothetical protein [Akkermansiaceae bacterium]
MRFRVFHDSSRHRFVWLFIVLLCAITVVALLTRDGKRQTPSWGRHHESPFVPEDSHESIPANSKAVALPLKVRDLVSIPNGEASGLRFICYNVENWLSMDRYVDQKSLKDAPKPESERQAVISILARHAPDVIGLSEIGQPADLAEIQQRLKNSWSRFSLLPLHRRF